MPIRRPEYRFTRTRLANDQQEVRVVLPATSADEPDIDLQDAEARKETSRWVLSMASGLARARGMDMVEAFYIIYASIVDTVDEETILRTIREGPCTPESLAAEPPPGVNPEVLRILLADLLDSGAVYMDGHLKCAGDN